MEPTEREDSSTYQSRQVSGESQLDRPVEPVRQPESPKKKSKATVVLVVLLLLALAGAGVFGWLWYQKSGEVDNVHADLSSTRNKVAQLESAAKAEAKSDVEESTVTTDTTSDSSNGIIIAALEYSKVRTGNRMYPDDSSKRQGVINKQDAQFAKVTVTASGTPSPSSEVIYLKKSSDGWIVIGDDSEDIEQLEIRFGLPDNF